MHCQEDHIVQNQLGTVDTLDIMSWNVYVLQNIVLVSPSSSSKILLSVFRLLYIVFCFLYEILLEFGLKMTSFEVSKIWRISREILSTSVDRMDF